MKTIAVAGAAAVVLWVSAAVTGCSDDQVTAAEPLKADRPRKIREAGGKPRPAKSTRPKPVLELEPDEDESPEAVALAGEIDDSLEREDLEAAKACAPRALKSRSPEVRRAMVDVLGWFGRDALPELLPFIEDGDEDVREAAKCEWSMALSDVEDENEKVRAVELVLRAVSDEDYLEDVAGEYTGVDEKRAVESIVRVIGAGGTRQGVAKAKEMYEYVTGDEWKDSAEAARWIREEYDGDDADAADGDEEG